MQNDIVHYLKEKYKPNAIILHGSRARGREREHSDWDFIFLYNSANLGQKGRELYKKHNIEFSSHTFPIDDIEQEFSIKLQGAKVVYEEDSIGTNLLNKANFYYQQGVHWPLIKIEDHKLWVQGRIDGMRDNVGNPIIFSKYYTDFYQRIFNYWYWIVQHSHSQPIYIAVEEIAVKDSEYFELVASLSNQNTSLGEKVKIAEKISIRLFQ